MSQLRTLLLVSAVLCGSTRGHSVQAPVAFVAGPESLADFAAPPAVTDSEVGKAVVSGRRRPAAVDKRTLFAADQPAVLRIFGGRLKADSGSRLGTLPASARALRYQLGRPTSAVARPKGPDSPGPVPRRCRRNGRKGRKGRKTRKGCGGRGGRRYAARRGAPVTKATRHAERPRPQRPVSSRPANAARRASSATWRPASPRRKIGRKWRRKCRALRRRGLKSMARLPARLLNVCQMLWKSRRRQRTTAVPAGHLYVGPERFRPRQKSW